MLRMPCLSFSASARKRRLPRPHAPRFPSPRPAAAMKSQEAERKPKKRLSRYGLSRLAWMAQRSSPAGRDALRVLQDALEAAYPAALTKAVRSARRREKKTGYPFAVIFAPTMERAIRKNRNAESQRFYVTHHWPFVVTGNPHQSRATAIVIWDTDTGRDVHHWVDLRKRGKVPA